MQSRLSESINLVSKKRYADQNGNGTAGDHDDIDQFLLDGLCCNLHGLNVQSTISARLRSFELIDISDSLTELRFTLSLILLLSVIKWIIPP